MKISTLIEDGNFLTYKDAHDENNRTTTTGF